MRCHDCAPSPKHLALAGHADTAQVAALRTFAQERQRWTCGLPGGRAVSFTAFFGSPWSGRSFRSIPRTVVKAPRIVSLMAFGRPLDRDVRTAEIVAPGHRSRSASPARRRAGPSAPVPMDRSDRPHGPQLSAKIARPSGLACAWSKAATSGRWKRSGKSNVGSSNSNASVWRRVPSARPFVSLGGVPVSTESHDLTNNPGSGCFGSADDGIRF